MPRRRSAVSALLVVTLVAMFLCVACGQVQARDLRGRFAVGFNNNFSSFSSVSVKIGLPTPKPTQNIQIQALVGFSISALVDGDDDRPAGADQFFAGGRLLLPILAEDNLNVYGSVGAGYVRQRALSEDESVSDPSLVVTRTGNVFRAQAGVGIEFFLFGLENLGFSAELGLKFDADPGLIEVKTTAGGAASVGIHYYF